MTKMKNKIAKTIAPAAKSTAEVSRGMSCGFIFNQPKMPAKLMEKTK